VGAQAHRQLVTVGGEGLPVRPVPEPQHVDRGVGRGVRHALLLAELPRLRRDVRRHVDRPDPCRGGHRQVGDRVRQAPGQ
jgi:hypothetical protein